MAVHRELTPLEAVALAVRSEIDSILLYDRLAARVRNPEVQRVLVELAAEEEEHRKHLMALYQSMLAGEEPSIPEHEPREKAIDVEPDAEFLAVMTAARDKELASETFYRDAAQTVADYKTRAFFLEVAETERRHYVVLQEQVEKLRQDPYWFDREDADPFKPAHVGP